jgi:outer membrane autotransporter protein
VAAGDVGYVIGARAGNGSTANITNSAVDFSGAAANYVYGALALEGASGNVTGSKVNITGGTIYQDAAGGEASIGDARSNTIDITNAAIGGSVFGGKSNSSIASLNNVTLTNVTVNGSVYGGFSNSAAAVTNSTVTLNNVTIEGDLIGGGSSAAANNTIIFSGGDSLVNGSLNNTDGDVSILAESNSVTVNRTASLRNLEIYGGTNTFKDNVSATGTVVIHAPSINVFSGVLDTAGNITISDGVNTFEDIVQTAGNITISNGFNTFQDIVQTAGNLTISDGTNTFEDNVDSSQNVQIGGSRTNIFRGYLNATGNITISGGYNTFEDIVQTAGNITIFGGENTFEDNADSAQNVQISGSSVNIFGGHLNAAGNISVTGGDNTFESNVESAGNVVISGTSVNLFAGYLNATGNITISGGTNTYAGDVNATDTLSFSGGTHNFNTTQYLESSSSIAVGGTSVFNLEAGTDLIAAAGLSFGNEAALNALGNSRITGTVFSAGTIDAGVNTLDIDGNLFLTNNSVLIFDFNGTSQGLINATGMFSLSNPEDKVKILTGTSNLLDEDSPILAAASGIDGLDDNFESSIYRFESFNDQLYPTLKSLKDILQYLVDEEDFVPTRNTVKAVDYLDSATESYLGSGDTDKIDWAANVYDVFSNVIAAADAANAAGLDGNRILTKFFRDISGESVINAYTAVMETALKTQGVVFKRLDRIHDAMTSVPPAAGGADSFNRVWAGGFGSWARQKNRGEIFGYDYNSGGFSIGYDRRAEDVPGLRFGIATSFSFGKIDSKSGDSSIDADTAGLGIYGSYMLNTGLFFDASFAYGHSENDSSVRTLAGAHKKGSFDIDTWQLGARAGYVIDLGTAKLTPTVGLRYLNAEQDGFAEHIIGSPALTLANTFNKKRDHIFEIPVLLKFNGTFETGQARIIPELRLGYTFAANRPDSDLQVGVVGGPGHFTARGIRAARGTFQAGAGAKFEVNDLVDVFVNYDLDAASGYVSHNAAAGVGFNF